MAREPFSNDLKDVTVGDCSPQAPFLLADTPSASGVPKAAVANRDYIARIELFYENAKSSTKMDIEFAESDRSSTERPLVGRRRKQRILAN
jgi:hypothetical protein